MSLERIPAADVLRRLADFSDVIDARSESEYAEDHLPGAINWPSLHDDERKLVGTEYKQISAFDAKKRGAALVAKNIAAHIEREVIAKPRDWQPLVYCWRGGKRSGVLAYFLDQIGFRVTLVDGGYKAFRAALVADLPLLAQKFQYRVVCGMTGSGKTRLLHALREEGAQVLDLEALANHRGSVLGLVPGTRQPTQKGFDRLVWTNLNRFDTERPVFVESESKKVGNVAIPEGLIKAMRAGSCLQLQLPEDSRVDLLLEDYDFLAQDRTYFCERLDALIEARGKETIEQWKSSVNQGDIAGVFRDLLVKHYDPVYLQSIKRNFSNYADATCIAPRDHSAAAMRELAVEILAPVSA